MNKVFNAKTKAGSQKSQEPRLLGNVVEENLDGWHRNTELGCDVKTMLRSDRVMKTGKEYTGVLRRDSDMMVDEFLSRDPHYTFVESLPPTAERRNVHIFEGRHITCTKRLNGSLRLNFKCLKLDAPFSVDGYALEVANEIRQALRGLVEK